MGREDRESEPRPKGSLKQSLSTPASSQVLLARAETITRGVGEFGGHLLGGVELSIFSTSQNTCRTPSPLILLTNPTM